jgi:Flp pilus assembly pilin Flp
MRARAAKCLEKLQSDQAGTTTIEYALIAAIVALGIFAVVGNVGDVVLWMFTQIQEGFERAQ